MEWERDAGIRRPRRRHAALGASLVLVPSLFGLTPAFVAPVGVRSVEGAVGSARCPFAHLAASVWAMARQWQVGGFTHYIVAMSNVSAREQFVRLIVS